MIMSSEESPPPPPPLLEDKWVKIQENTFTNWVNQQLRDTEYQISSLDGQLSQFIIPLFLITTR